VSQVQGTVAAALEPMRSQLQLLDDQSAPTGETVYTVEPRSFLVVGSLGQFMTEHGVHAAKFKSFELFRRNTVRPEIITFDELFHRAKFIVDNASGI
jgi:Shedu protein SduA, C-terminal